MSTKRRFTEKEIAKIFEKATRAQNAVNEESGAGEGLSLEDLKQIAESTGIDPAFITQAIADMDRDTSHPALQKHMGLPFGLSRSVKLPASFSDTDWEQLVVDLRRTFNHRGEIKQDGSFREWSHAYTHAYVEPSPDGYELRLEAKNGNIKPFFWVGILYILFAFVLFGVLSSGADPGLKTALIVSGLAMAAGIGMFSSSFFVAPRWIRKMEQQFDGICERTTARVDASESEGGESAEQLSSPSEKFLTIEDEEDLNQELKQFAKRTSTKR